MNEGRSAIHAGMLRNDQLGLACSMEIEDEREGGRRRLELKDEGNDGSWQCYSLFSSIINSPNPKGLGGLYCAIPFDLKLGQDQTHIKRARN